MEFFKDFFNDDKIAIGLCKLTKRQKKTFEFSYKTKFNPQRFVYETNTSKNFFLL